MNLEFILKTLEEAAMARREVDSRGPVFHDDDEFSVSDVEMLSLSDINKLRKFLTRVQFNISNDKQQMMTSFVKKIQNSWPNRDKSAHEAWHTIIQVASRKGFRVW